MNIVRCLMKPVVEIGYPRQDTLYRSAFRPVGGSASASGTDLSRLDIAAPVATLDLLDAVLIARKVAGLDAIP